MLTQFKETGIKKVITFCPGCDRMLQTVYPQQVEGFDIEVQNFAELAQMAIGETPPHRITYVTDHVGKI